MVSNNRDAGIEKNSTTVVMVRNSTLFGNGLDTRGAFDLFQP